jgi:hypothetical protein
MGVSAVLKLHAMIGARPRVDLVDIEFGRKRQAGGEA